MAPQQSSVEFCWYEKVEAWEYLEYSKLLRKSFFPEPSMIFFPTIIHRNAARRLQERSFPTESSKSGRSLKDDTASFADQMRTVTNKHTSFYMTMKQYDKVRKSSSELLSRSLLAPSHAQ
eukprot:scaffold4433_cov122-Cylindrotheca_fusiformis.AAC.4